MAATRYSPTFRRLISDGRRLQALLEGSCVYGATFAEWEEGRRFIASAINQDGAILDVGCGNGFLLRCLQEWSPNALEPYGIDIDVDRLRETQSLFPERADHFAVCDALAFVEQARRDECDPPGFPPRFALIYWNAGDNVRFIERRWLKVVAELRAKLEPGGRLIVGLYDPSKTRNWSRIDELRDQGYRADGVAEAPRHGEVIAWFDRPTHGPVDETTGTVSRHPHPAGATSHAVDSR